MNNDLIKQNVLKLQNANATPEDIESYVKSASQEQQPTPDAPADTSYNQGIGIIKGVGNFLFPIVGDLYHDVKGDSTKNWKQQLGDTALSALPFIPGLGEIGEGARAVDAGVEGVSLLSKAVANPVVRNTAVGYGAGVASNLSQGKDFGESLMPNINTVGGAIAGGFTPKIMQGISKLVDNISGINPQVANELKNMATNKNPEDLKLFNSYNNAAATHATNVRTPSVENIAADNLDAAASKIEENTKAAGQAVGQAKQVSGNLPLQPVQPVASTFANEVKQRFGLQINSSQDGQIVVSKIPGSLKDVPAADIARIKGIAENINKLQPGSTSGNAVDALWNIDQDLNYSPKDVYGKSLSPIDGLVSETRHNLSQVLRDSAPVLADANDRFSGLKALQQDITEMAGNKLQRGEMLMRRIFSNKSQDSLVLFDKIKAETGIDLTKHAVLAKNAIDNYGSNADKSALQQTIESSLSGHNDIISHILNIGKNIANRTVANPKKISRSMITGTPRLLNKLAPYATKSAIEAGSRPGDIIGAQK